MTTTNFIMNGTYDLTNIISKDAIENPATWIANFNIQMDNIFIITFLVIFGLILYLIARRNESTTDAKAIIYAGFITSIIGIFIFVINITAYPDLKLVTWVQLLPILIITGFAIYFDKTNRTF